MSDSENHADSNDEIVWEQPQWEPTQKDPLDLWSGLPDKEWRYEIMKERASCHLPLEEKKVVSAVVEALAAYLNHAGPKTRRFVHELVGFSQQPSEKTRALITRIIVDRALMPLSRWPEWTALDRLITELGLDDVATVRVRKLAGEVRRETGAMILRGVLEEPARVPPHALLCAVEFRDYDTLNCSPDNLRGLYLAQVKKSDSSG